MKTILTIGASTSKTSINKEFAEYTGDLLNNLNVIKIDLNNFEMPLFSIDIEAEQGFPKGATDLNAVIEKSDAVIFPGVGAFGSVMESIRKNNLESIIKKMTR